MAAKESEIQAAIKEYLQWTGWFCVKIHQSLGSYRGIADLYALKDGKSIWIEVKTPKGRLSKYQEQFRDDVLAHGGTYIVARSVDDVERVLRALGISSQARLGGGG
jgi:hypothetical protein